MERNMSGLKELFTEHPNSVNETYVEHMQMSGGFALKLFAAAFFATAHAFLPFLFDKTASKIITGLHDRMVSNRVVRPAPVTQSNSGEQTV
jgi:Family of unknown function (DUF6356)